MELRQIIGLIFIVFGVYQILNAFIILGTQVIGEDIYNEVKIGRHKVYGTMLLLTGINMISQ